MAVYADAKRVIYETTVDDSAENSDNRFRWVLVIYLGLPPYLLAHDFDV